VKIARKLSANLGESLVNEAQSVEPGGPSGLEVPL
jgi:hypothetical protein